MTTHRFLYNDTNIHEIGVDEAGRGPMFGRVYASAVVLPKNMETFDFTNIKDSKKFHSSKRITQVSEYIKQHAVAWAVAFEDENTIDNINILQATQSAMHKAINKVIDQIMAKGKQGEKREKEDMCLLVDGNYFNTYTYSNKSLLKSESESESVKVPYHLIKGGDAAYSSIAAASILAKVERDKYIQELCLEYPMLVELYGIDFNKGYGSKKHLEGIQRYGITKWHRKTFGSCKTASIVFN